MSDTPAGESTDPSSAHSTDRAFCGRWLSVIALALLANTFVLLAWLWIEAYRLGVIPERWGEYHGNHGPWRHWRELDPIMHNMYMMPCLAFMVGLAALLVKPSWRALLVTALSPVVFLILLHMHYWLTD